MSDGTGSAPQTLQGLQQEGIAVQIMLDHGLEDALCDLVAVHGPQYLDAFLERRLRRTTPQLTMPFGNEAIDSQRAQSAAVAEDWLKRLVERVRANPAPVPR